MAHLGSSCGALAGLSVLLLWAASQWIAGLSWGALIVGVILALKVLLLTPWVQSVADRRSAAQAELAHQSTKIESSIES